MRCVATACGLLDRADPGELNDMSPVELERLRQLLTQWSMRAERRRRELAGAPSASWPASGVLAQLANGERSD